ncbi:hypothetical protein BDZ89DRAFT_1132640 [Hymenopellis radicata]|nr:hypothetical protein BDZ89DRAFT_1132640 [Hymenopellis radicata]
MTSRSHAFKRPLSPDIDGDSDVEILEYTTTPSTPPRVQKRQAKSSAKRRPVIDIDDDTDLVAPALASTSKLVNSRPEVIDLDSDDLPLPATPVRKRRKHAHIPAIIISDDESDNDEIMPKVAQLSLAGTAGRQAAPPISWEAWCNEHALKPNGEILQQQKGMHVMHYSDVKSFFKFTKEELAPLPYYTFPNGNVAGATGSAYRWVDLLYHAFRKEAVLKDKELGLKPPGDPTEQAMFMKGKDFFKTKLERDNDRYKKQYGKERFAPEIRVVRPNGGQLVSYRDKAVAARHRDLKDCECTTTHVCEDPKKPKKGKNAAKHR